MQHRYVKCALLVLLEWADLSGCGGGTALGGDAANEDPAEVCEKLEIIDFILSQCTGG